MRNYLIAAGLVAAMLTAVPAGAQTTATPIPAPPKPDLSAQQAFIGSWSCSEQSSRRPSPTLSTSTYAMDPSGYWVVQKSTSSPTAWYPHSISSTDYITYDGDQKRWVDLYVDNGGGYSVSTSPGPVAKTWTWHDMGLQKPQADVASYTDGTTTWVDKDNYTFGWSFTTKDGKTVSVKGSCKRTS